MIYVQHRVNLVEQLSNVNPEFGVEVDLRSSSTYGEIYLEHDPWQQGTSFDSWLHAFVRLKIRGPIILNTKEDGLETHLINKMKSVGISNFLFLDTTVPTIKKMLELGYGKHCFVRHSTLEPLEFTQLFAGRVEWAWMDCFGAQPMPMQNFLQLKSKFQLCLVSPELHQMESDLSGFLSVARVCDMICTKRPSEWQRML